MPGLRLHDLITIVAGSGLPGTTLQTVVEPLDDALWRDMIRFVRRHRLQGFLSAAVTDERLVVTDEQWDDVVTLHVDAMAQALRLERVLLRVADLLEAAGVDYRVIKGLALAHLDYPDPAHRGTGDIDLLVRASHLDIAVQAVADAGFTRTWPQLRAGFDRRFGKAVTTRRSDGTWLDLHRTFSQEPLGLLVDNADLFARCETYSLGGRDMPALAVEERLLAACYNAALNDVPPRMVALRDVAQIALATSAPDVEIVRATASRWSGQVVVARAVGLAWERFAVRRDTPLSRWAQSYKPTATDERLLAAHLGPAKGQARRALESVRLIEKPLDRIAYLRAVLVPDRSFLRRRGVDGYRAWLRRGARSVTGDDR